MSGHETVYIMSGTQRDALDYAWRNGIEYRRIRHIRTREQLMGLRGITIYKLQSAYDLTEFVEIMTEVKLRNCIIKEV